MHRIMAWNSFYRHYAIKTFESVWYCTLPPGIQAWETIKPSCFTGKRRKADGHFFGPWIFGNRDVLVCDRRQEGKGKVVARGGKQSALVKLLNEELLRMEMCKGGDGMLLNCLWSLEPGWFSSPWYLVEEETNFVPYLLMWRFSAVHCAVFKDLSLKDHCSYIVPWLSVFPWQHFLQWIFPLFPFFFFFIFGGEIPIACKQSRISNLPHLTYWLFQQLRKRLYLMLMSKPTSESWLCSLPSTLYML